MNRVPRNRLARWLGIAALLAGAGLALALLGAWSGIVNISASAGHPQFVERFLELGLRSSVRHHSRNLVPPADLDSRERVLLGAAHFAGGCAECHGAPGDARNPIYDYMLPVPPDLAALAPTWNARELFFIVRHGLQFTGMPGWSGGARDDEVWSMVAFLRALPALDVEGYRALASGNMNLANPAPGTDAPPITAAVPRSPAALRVDGGARLARAACDRCHDTELAAPTSALVPRLAGQPAAYLERALREYRSGERRSGFMQPVVAQLDEREIVALAVHYSAMPPVAAAPAGPQLSSAEQVEAATIAGGTHDDLRLPACLSCHGAGARADYPALGGQPAAYLAQQLRLFQDGGRRTSAWGEVMTVIATRLDAGQVDLLARWFARQPAPGAEPSR